MEKRRKYNLLTIVLIVLGALFIVPKVFGLAIVLVGLVWSLVLAAISVGFWIFIIWLIWKILE